jgi:signal transduction histidine kinase
VEAAEKISGGDMNFELKPLSNDELGFLAAQFEQMRARLLANHIEIEKSHEESLMSERLAATGKFAAGIIHDLKNPLAVVRASTELMQRKIGDDPKVARHCLNINQQIDRMLDLTRDILEYSRGNTQLELKTVNLDQFFKEIVEFHSIAFKKGGLHLRTEGENGLTVNIDPSRFRRVIDNLLNNAREALKPGNRVTVQWVKSIDKLVISVSDNGPGIPDDIRNFLFDPFVTHGKENGTGLGLAVAKKIIEDHGAAISFDSKSGVGTTFNIELPIVLIETTTGEVAATI